MRSMKMRNVVTLLAAVVILSVSLLVGCTAQTSDVPEQQTPDNQQNTADMQAGEEKGTVHLIYVQWACAEAETHIAEAVLEDMGYDVKKDVVEAGVMWAAVASGDADVFTTAWLPYTHESYWEEYQNDVEDLGALFEGAKLGLVVPDYVTIDSIAARCLVVRGPSLLKSNLSLSGATTEPAC